MRAVLRAIASHQRQWAEAFATGLRRHGWRADIRTEAEPCDLLVMWGTRQREAIESQKRYGEVCILERGYIGDRFEWTSVSFGGKLNGRAEFRGAIATPERFERHFAELMRPWRHDDGYALLIGQVEGDMSLAVVGGRLDAWYRETSEALRRKGYEVRFRPHPGTIKRGSPIVVPPEAKMIVGTLAEAFAGAGLVVTFNSNTGVESVLAGAPTIATDIGSMAWRMTSHDVEGHLIRPDRAGWAHALAWKQWRLDEMASGYCWDVVGRRSDARRTA